MMDSFTHYYKSISLHRVRLICIIASILFCIFGVHPLSYAQNAVDANDVRLERSDENLELSVQLQFELPAPIEDALLKGIPMVFVMDTELLRDRWYWYDKKQASAQRQIRLAYQALTRRWKITQNAGTNTAGALGLSLSQSYDTLDQALAVIKRVSGWRVASLNDLEVGGKYKLEFRFKLDLSQLPRPFQIGAIGQANWEMSTSFRTPVTLDNSK
jgi:hypothetical protein